MQRLQWLLLCVLFAVGSPDRSTHAAHATPAEPIALRPILALPPVLVENHGQFPAAVRYRTVGGGQVTTITDDGLILTLIRTVENADGASLVGHNVRLRFEAAGSPATASPHGSESARTRCSYFIGNDPAGWHSDVPTWSAVTFDGLAPAYSCEVHARRGICEYDLLATAGAPIEDVEVVVDGADSVSIRDDGSVDIVTPAGLVCQESPRTWEVAPDGERRELSCRAVLRDSNRFVFAVTGRDPDRPLVVDPGLGYSTFVEGSEQDYGDAIAVDSAGAAYIVGTAISSDFPVTPGAFQPTKTPNDPSARDAVVAKLAPDGASLEYATYLGGHGGEYPEAIVVDGDGQAYVAGGVYSDDFPTTPGAYSEAAKGIEDAFVTKLDATGTELIYSTYFGGSGQTAQGADGATCLALDSLGRAVIGGITGSTDLPVTPHCPQGGLPAAKGGFVARLTADGSGVDFCTYVGCHEVRGVATDANFALYAAGRALFNDGLPLTPGAFQSEFDSNNFGDAFVLRITPSGPLAWCTLVGGIDDDRVAALQVDSASRPVLAGWTSSYNFPTTPSSFDPIMNGGDQDGYVVKLAADGSSLIWGAFMGGGDTDYARDLALDAQGNCYVVSQTRSTNMPATSDAFDATLNSPPKFDSHVAKIAADGSQLLYASYIGSSGDDIETPNGIAVDSHGNPYLTGYTAGTDFPTTPESLDPEISGFTGLFVVKFDLLPWLQAGYAKPGTGGIKPKLTGTGTLVPLSPGALQMADARPDAPCWLVLGLSSLMAPFKGGVLVPSPLVSIPLLTSAAGTAELSWSAWPAGFPPYTSLWLQYWVADPFASLGFAASNALQAVTPESQGP
jgi:hypothetical protein